MNIAFVKNREYRFSYLCFRMKRFDGKPRAAADALAVFFRQHEQSIRLVFIVFPVDMKNCAACDFPSGTMRYVSAPSASMHIPVV